jgi:cytidylate kinase
MTPSRKAPANPEKTVICISGMAGTGKSTLSKKIAEKYGLKYFSGGNALKELAKEQGYEVFGEGWWESPQGIQFLQERKNNQKYDKEVDDILLKQAADGNVLLDSWTMPWLLKGGFKIWLMASLEKRAARVAIRDSMTLSEASRMLNEKESHTKAIYEHLYGFLLGEDLSPFDLILDTDNLNPEEVFGTICQVLDGVVFKA